MIDFDAESHTYKRDGKIVPSVTQIIAPLYDFSFVNPDVLERAADFGRAVHLACELYDKDELDIDSLDDALRPYLDGWVAFKAECSVTVFYNEQKLFSDLYGFAGTVDRIASIDKKTYTLDIKSCTSVSDGVGPQLAGYEIMARERGFLPKKSYRAAVQLKGNGRYSLHEFKSHADHQTFLSLLTIHKWRNKHAA